MISYITNHDNNVRYNIELALNSYDKWMYEKINVGEFVQVNKKRYQLVKDDYIITVVLQEHFGDALIEVYDTVHQEFIISGVVPNSLIKKKLIKEFAFYNKALIDNSLNKLGITMINEKEIDNESRTEMAVNE